MQTLSLYKPFSKSDVLPSELVEAYENGNLAVFIGAGISRLAGCQDWSSLGKDLIESCYTNGYINFKSKERLINSSDSKKNITIAYNVFLEKDNEKDFFKVFKKSLKPKKNKIDIYQILYDISDVFITTNADELFRNVFKSHNNSNVFCELKDFNESNLVNYNRKVLFEIHGRKKLKDSLVFTTKEYLERYTNEGFRNFLEKIFHDYVVLFIGYGLSEFELLDYTLLKGKNTKKHYLLKEKFLDDDQEFIYESSYYETLNIQTIPFELDENGYDQQIEEIKALREKLIIYSKNKPEEELETFFNHKPSKDEIEGFIDKYITMTGMLKEILGKLYIRENDFLIDSFFFSMYNRGLFSSNSIFNKKTNLTWYYFDFLRLSYNKGSKRFAPKRLEVLKDLTGSDNFKVPYITNALVEFIFSLDENSILDFLVYLKEATINEPFLVSYSFANVFYTKILNFKNEELVFELFDLTFGVRKNSIQLNTSIFDPSSLEKIVNDYLDILCKKYGIKILEHLIDIFEKNFSERKNLRVSENERNLFREEYDYEVSLGNLIWHLYNKFGEKKKILSFFERIEIIKQQDFGLIDSDYMLKRNESKSFSELILQEEDDLYLNSANREIIRKYFENFEKAIQSLDVITVKTYSVKTAIIEIITKEFKERNSCWGIEYILTFLEKDFLSGKCIEKLFQEDEYHQSPIYYYVGAISSLITEVFNRADREIPYSSVKRFLRICIECYSENDDKNEFDRGTSLYSNLSITLNSNPGKITESIICIFAWLSYHQKEEETSSILTFLNKGIHENRLVLISVFMQYLRVFFKTEENWLLEELNYIVKSIKTPAIYENFWYGHQGFYIDLYRFLDKNKFLRTFVVDLPKNSMVYEVELYILTSAYLRNISFDISIIDILKNDTAERQLTAKVIRYINHSIKFDSKNDFKPDFLNNLRIFQSELYDIISSFDDSKYKSICVKSMCKWLIVLKNLKDIVDKKYLDCISPESSIQLDLYDLVKTFEILSKKEEDGKLIIRILLSFSERRLYIEYPREEMEMMFKNLYTNNKDDVQPLLRKYFIEGILSSKQYEKIKM